MGRRPTTGYENEEIPDHMPPANQGAPSPVVVRLVDGELGVWSAATTTRSAGQTT
jgi:hypothetical protein